MRTLRVFGLALSIGLLVLGSIAQAQEKSPPLKAQTAGDPGGEPATVDILDPLELYFFFQHLANVDAAADAADAEDTFDTSSWRTVDQRAAGLTDFEGTLVKEIASACLQSLSDHDAAVQAAAGTGTEVLPERMQIVAAAVDELRLQLGEERFQVLASYVHAELGSGLEVVSSPPGPLPPGSGVVTVEDPAADAVPAIFQASVGGHVTKLSGPAVLAECFTNLTDDAVRQNYPAGVTGCSLLSNGLPTEPVPCNGTGQCVSVFGALPGLTRWTEGFHGLGMYQGQCTPPDATPYPGLLDPLHFCRSVGTPVPFYQPSGQVTNLGGDPMCWPSNGPGSCLLAQTRSNLVTFIDIFPFEASLGQNEQQTFNTNIPATLSLVAGPGFLQGNVYTAPATLSGPQTASLRACDAFQPQDDCIFATIHLEPLKVEVTPESLEVLPEGEVKFTAAVSPQGRQVEWTLSLPADAPPGSPAGIITASEDTFTGTYKAPKNDDISLVAQVTVKACMKPAPSGGALCDTAQVTVPKMQFLISGSKHDLRPNETLQLTAIVQGSSLTPKVKWQLPFAGSLTPVDSTETLDNTRVVLYKAPSTPIGNGEDVKACFQESPSFCATYHVNFLPDVAVDSITSDTGAWNAGTLTPFTVTGVGFGSDPSRISVNFGGMPASVTLVTDTKIQGVARLLVSLGGKTIKPAVRLTYPNGDFADFTPISISIVPASLSVSPAAPVDLHAGQSQQYSALCLAGGAPCTSQETPGWSANPGEIDANGKYTAPPAVTANTTATISACWGAGYCATTHANLIATADPVVTVSPKTAKVRVGQTQPFTATVTNNANTAVTWSLNPQVPEAGNISQTGLYTAPATFGGVTTVTVIATSQADGTKSDSATVTLYAPPTITVTPSPPSANVGTTLTWTVTVSGGSPATYQYAIFRRRAGAPAWIPDQTAPAWQASNVFSWTPLSTDTGNWEILIWVKDDSTPPNIYPVNPGNVQIATPITSLTCTPSPAAALYGNAINWTATPNGGIPASTQYALFRRRAGATDWTPLVTAPNWQSSNPLSWTPASADAGTWEIIVWAKDGTTPANQNTYGYAAYCNPGPVRVVGPLSVTSTPSPAAAYSGTAITWTATASGGDAPTTQFALVRKPAGTATWLPATPAWQTSGVLTWTPAAGETGNWDIAIRVKDATTPANPGYAASYNPGQVQVVPPLTLTGTASPASASYGNPITWTLTANGGTGVNRQYAFFRRRAGTTPWTPDVTAAAWQSSNVFNWTPGSTDTGTWEIIFWAKDSATPANMNAYGYAAYFNAGPVQIVPPLTVTCTGSPAASLYGNAITWTASITGGVPASAQYALFRRRAGATAWTPDVTAPNWQSSNPLSWTPVSTDVGTWEIIVWAKDGTTPPTLNTYGYASYCNPGPVRVVAPLGVTSTPSPAAAYYGTAISWTATASGGDAPTTQYAFSRRRAGTPDWIPSTAVWQTSNAFSWTPTAADAGSWETTIVVKDVTTPPTANGGYGYAAITSPGVVQVVTPPSLSVTASPAWSLSGNAITWTATASGGTGTNVQYAFFRRRSGTTPWTPSVTAPSWQASRTYSWTPSATDAGNWDVYVWVKDSATPSTMNTYGYAAGANPGGVQVVAPMTVSGTGSPSPVYSGTTITWTANASGNTPSTTRYALFRRRLGTTPWTPDVTAPAWQSSNTLSWTPASTETGTWEIIIWAKDGNTPANMNTYGYAAYYNAGTVQVVTPPTVSGTGSPSSAYYGPTLTWTANVSGGTGTGIRYAFFRRRSGTTPWTPDVTAAAWQTSNTMSWTPTSADVGTWEIIIWAKDSATPANMNTYGFATYYNAGPVQIVAPAPLTVSGTGSPSTSPYGTSISWTANASGGVPSTIKYALFRKLAGTSNWIPDVTAPAWQTSNVLRWTPSASDVGTWEIIIWVKDVNTSPTQNTYGFAAYYNAQPVQVVSP